MKQPVTCSTLMKIKSVSQPTYASGEVYFVETWIDQKADRYKSVVKSVNQETEKVTEWSPASGAYHSPSLSPDGQWLAYLGQEEDAKTAQVYVISLSGGVARQVSQEAHSVTHFVWSHDSQSLYYQFTDPGQDRCDHQDQVLPWHFSRSRYQADGQGFVVDGESYHIARRRIQEIEPSCSAELVFSSDQPFSLNYIFASEQSLLYTAAYDLDDAWPYANSVYQLDLATGQSTRWIETQRADNLYFQAAQAGEQYFLFSGHHYEYGFVDQTELYLYDAKTARLTRLTANADLECSDVIIGDIQQHTHSPVAQWLSDKEFVFWGTYRGRTVIYRGDLSGHTELINDDAHHLTGASFACDHTWVASQSTTTTPSRIVAWQEGQLGALYDPNQALMAELSLSQPEPFEYLGAEGDLIQAWYMPPINEAEVESYPVVLYIHGGPQVAYGETFFHEMQRLAGHGYGLILINPHGSNSYGQAFTASILGDYGNKDYEDLMKGLEVALERYSKADPDQVYVAGGSYGGFMTGWIVGHSHRFRRAVCQRMVSNWLSFYGTSDIGARFVEFQLRHDLTGAAELWRMSPVAYADQVKTPLLVLHGAEDHRCPLGQGQEMYNAVKRHYDQIELIIYPESSHGLSRNGRPSLRCARLRAISDWFAQGD